MKHLLQTLVLTLCISLFSFAQSAPSNFINYQGVASDASGNTIANTAINLQIALKFGSPTATASYIENHSPTTDANGLFNIKIGNGILVSGTYDTTAFGSNASYITVSLNGAEVGTTELNAVPYALSSGDKLWEVSDEILMPVTNAQSVSISQLFVGVVRSDLFSGFEGDFIERFSNDASLTNSFDNETTVPTQFAVKTYVDFEISNATSNLVTSINDLSDAKSNNFDLFIGKDAGMLSNELFNTGIGAGALKVFTSGSLNTALGYNSLVNMGSGNQNLAIGSQALQAKTSGDNNTAIGVNTLLDNLTGSGNVAVGFEAGRNETGSNKLYIANTDTSDPLIYGEFDNRLLIFNGDTNMNGSAEFSDSATFNFGLKTINLFSGNPNIVLGGTSNTTTGDDGIISSDPDYAGSDIFLRSNDAVVIELDVDENETGQFEIKRGDGALLFDVYEDGNATLAGTLNQNSDRRLKKDIEKLPYGLKEVLQLEPKFYNWKSRKENHKSLGLIAQDVQEVIKEIVTAKDDDQKTLSVSYIELIPVLINAIKEQQSQIETLKTTNTNKDVALTEILKRVQALEYALQTEQKESVNIVVTN